MCSSDLHLYADYGCQKPETLVYMYLFGIVLNRRMSAGPTCGFKNCPAGITLGTKASLSYFSQVWNNLWTEYVRGTPTGTSSFGRPGAIDPEGNCHPKTRCCHGRVESSQNDALPVPCRDISYKSSQLCQGPHQFYWVGMPDHALYKEGAKDAEEEQRGWGGCGDSFLSAGVGDKSQTCSEA